MLKRLVRQNAVGGRLAVLEHACYAITVRKIVGAFSVRYVLLKPAFKPVAVSVVIHPVVGAEVVPEVSFVFNFTVGVVLGADAMFVALFKFTRVPFARRIHKSTLTVFAVARYTADRGPAYRSRRNRCGAGCLATTGAGAVATGDVTGRGADASAGRFVIRLFGYIASASSHPLRTASRRAGFAG